MFLLFVAVLILLVWVSRLQGRVNELEARIREQAARPSSEPGRPHAPAPLPSTPPVPPAAAASPARQAPRPEPPPAPPVPQPSSSPPPPSVTPSPPAPEPAGRAGAGAFDWEALVGVTLFSWIAGIALALGGIFFLRYSIQNGWLQPPVRLAMGLAAGLGLLGACETRWARRYAITANALAAAGLVILFSTFYAAYALWQIAGALVAFAGLVVVAVVAVLLSLRHDSLFIALLGLLGGFAAPALLSSGEDRPFTLFGYLLLLNAGLAWVAYRRRWIPLVAVSLVFTTLYQWSWVFTFLSPQKVPLALAIFTAFPLLSWGLLAWIRRGGEQQGEDPFATMAGVNAALPLLLALYLALAPGYAARFPIVFGFLFLVDAALFAIARARGPQELHALGAGMTVLVFLEWWGTSASAAAHDRWRVVLAFVALFVLFYLWTDRRVRRSTRPFRGVAARAGLAAPLLLFMFPALALSEPGFASPWLPGAILLALAALVAAHAVAERDALPYAVASVLATAWAWAWSVRALQAGGPWTAVTVYAALAIFLLAVPLAARRHSAGTFAVARLEALALVPQAFLLFVAARPGLATPAWALFVGAAVIHLAVAAATLALPDAPIQVAALTLSPLILAVWTVATRAADASFLAMAASTALAAFALACRGAAWARRHPALPSYDAAAAVALLLGQLVVVLAERRAGAPGVTAVAAFHVLLLSGLLALAAWSGRLWLPVLAVVPMQLGCVALVRSAGALPGWAQPLALALPLYALFVAYPLLIAPRLGDSLGPHAAAALASLAFFTVANPCLDRGGFGDVLGLLPLAQAGVMGVLLAAVLRQERAGFRYAPRITLVAATLLAFVTIAVPVQFDGQWVTVGWAVEGVVLAWVYTRVRQHPLLWAALGLLAVSALKGFLLDMARLGGLYRVASFVGLAVCLALAAVLLQRFVFARKSG